MPNPRPKQTDEFKKAKFKTKRPLTEPLADKVVGVKLYASDLAYLQTVEDRPQFLREAVREKIERERDSASAFAELRAQDNSQSK